MNIDPVAAIHTPAGGDAVRRRLWRQALLILLCVIPSCAKDDYYSLVDRHVGKTVLQPAALTFVDTNAAEDVISGDLAIGTAPEEKYVKEYRLYWGSGPSAKLAGYGSIAVYAADGTVHTHTFTNEPVPAGATHLLVYSANDEGEMDEPKALDIPDLVVRRIADIYAGAASSSPGPFVVYDGRLFYRAGDAIRGGELWVWDGSTNALFADINTGANDSNPANFFIYNSVLYFTATDGSNGYEPWRTDGTPANTYMMMNITGNAGDSYTTFYTVYNGYLYFYAYDPAIGSELRWTDGVNVSYYDLSPGSSDSDISRPVVYNGKLYFGAREDGTTGNELWSFDGTTATLIRDIYTTAGFSSAPSDFFIFNNRMFFGANDGASGRELWVSDGTTAGTTLFMDINPGASGSSPTLFTVCNGKLFFVANGGASGLELWVSDGTPGGTHLVRDINPSGDGFSLLGGNRLCVINNRVYFAANNSVDGTEVWTSDGTAAGTYMLKNIHPTAGSNPENFYCAKGLLYFRATDGTNGIEPWVSDGTAAGTRMIADISPGAGNSGPNYFTVFNGKLYFAANDGSYGVEPYVYYIK